MSKTRLSSLFKFKDKISKYFRSHIVYKILCNCYNATYYGQTEWYLFIRSTEHLGIIPLTGDWIKNRTKSVINERILLKDHDPAYDDFSIHLYESNAFKLHIIKKDQPELNRNAYSYPLRLFDLSLYYLRGKTLLWNQIEHLPPAKLNPCEN